MGPKSGLVSMWQQPRFGSGMASFSHRPNFVKLSPLPPARGYGIILMFFERRADVL